MTNLRRSRNFYQHLEYPLPTFAWGVLTTFNVDGKLASVHTDSLSHSQAHKEAFNLSRAVEKHGHNGPFQFVAITLAGRIVEIVVN